MIELIIVFLIALTVPVAVHVTEKYGAKVYTAERGSRGRMVLLTKGGNPENDEEWIYHPSKRLGRLKE